MSAQPAVASGSASASRTTRVRAGRGSGASSVTAAGVVPSRRSSLPRPYCGWPCGARFSSSSASCAAGDNVVSRPGRTIIPRGSLASAANRLAVTGREPVDPAAMTGRSPNSSGAASACRRSTSLRSAAASALPRCANSRGQNASAISRKCRVFCQLAASSGVAKSAVSRPRSPPSMVRSSTMLPSESASPKISAAFGGVAKISCPPTVFAQALSSRASVRRRSWGEAAGGNAGKSCGGRNGSSSAGSPPKVRMSGSST